MKTIIGICRFLAALYQVAVGVCPACGGRIGDGGDAMSIEMEYCECCDNGTIWTRREVFRRWSIRR